MDSNGLIYVANLIGGASSFGSITVYAAGATGNVAPVATITGSDTGLSAPQGIAVDGAGNVFVANLTGGLLENGSVTVYAAGSNGDVAPINIISGPQAETFLLVLKGSMWTQPTISMSQTPRATSSSMLPEVADPPVRQAQSAAPTPD